MSKEFQKFWVSQAAVLFSGDKCLLVKSTKSGLYGLPGGRIDIGEEKSVALTRELQEEIGITNFEHHGIADYLVFYDLPSGIKLESPVCAIINIVSSADVPILKDKMEISEMIWVKESEIGNYKYCWYNLEASIKKAFIIYNKIKNNP